MSRKKLSFGCLFLLSGLLMVLLAVGSVGGLFQSREETAVFRTPGLYWFGPDGAAQIADPGQNNPYFDPTRPTIIFVHGWLPDQVTTPPTFILHRETNTDNTTAVYDLARPWIADGWNIGLYYWHPYADEGQVWDAEAKIWTADSAVGMRRRDANGDYHTADMPAVSAAELFYKDFTAAMQPYSGPEIRIAGHSLGNQMAVRLVDQIIQGIEAGEIEANLLPTRLALLDPFWTLLPKDFLDGRRVGDALQGTLADEILPAGVLVEWYRSSLLTAGVDLGYDLAVTEEQAVFVELSPDFCPVVDQVCRHDAAWHLYFLSYGFSPPQECVVETEAGECVSTGRPGPMAGADNETIARMMAEPYRWRQIGGPEGENGRLTLTTADDWYQRLPIQSDDNG